MRFFEEGTFDAAKMEERVLEFWDTQKTFEKSLEKTKGGAPFTFYDGPPFATGLPHYGHILASTIKDVIPRYQTMRGRFVRRRWGWDCHGLPIEEVVERELGISGKKQIEEIGIKTFNEKCRSMVLQYVNDWRAMVRRIARWVEFDDSYKTMDRDYMESVWWAFKQIYDKELVYEGRKVLLYCPRCETPISNFEVAMDNSYKDVTEEAVTVKFKVRGETNMYFLAWTTTPWTLPGNVALAVGENIDYVKVKITRGEHEGNSYIVALSRLADTMKGASVMGSGNKLDGQDFKAVLEIGKAFKGSELVGFSYEPLFDVPAVQSDKAFKVYAANFVNTEEGTGIVHTAVVYGEDDYALGLSEGLPVVPLLDEKGKFNEQSPELIRGQYFKSAEKVIKSDLESRGLLLKREQYQHSYPHCWRCGTMLFYNAIPAWFINIQRIKKDLIASNDREINWFPEHLKHGRYEKSVEAAPDWNISRNRYWGNPIPVWKCESCGKETVVGSVEELQEKSERSKNRYWVMRHGEAQGNVEDIIDSGQQEFHLTDQGREQVKRSAAALREQGIELIIASDILRTRETAAIAAETLGVKDVIFDARLHEIALGALSGQHTAAYTDALPRYEDRLTKKPEDGESLQDVRKRAWEFLVEVEQQYEGKKILLISHEDPIWMLCQVAEGWSDEKTVSEKADHDGIFMHPGEVRPVTFKNLPRNDWGAVDLHRPYIDAVTLKCDTCGSRAKKITEIFDSWVEAGSMPFAEYHYPFENRATFEQRFPSQFVTEYIAQTRAWFYVMHVISFILFGKAPFENVLTTGTILAEDGSKMSKSKKNFPDPSVVIDRYGADSLRFYLMNSVVMQAENVNFDQRDLEKIHRKVVMIFYNVYNYFSTYAREAKWQANNKNAASESVLDRWIETRTKELVRDVTKHLDSYDTVWATRAIESYIDDLSTWYLRRSRGRTDAGFFATFYRTLLSVSQMIAPFMPHLAEAVYLSLAEEFDDKAATESVHLTDWPAAEALTKEETATLEMMAAVREAASAGQAIRKEKSIPVRQPLAALRVVFRDKSKSLPPEFSAILLSELNIKTEDQSIEDENNTVSFEGGERIEKVLISTALTEELELEGLARGMERFIQGLRKKQGFKVGEMATLTYATDEKVFGKTISMIDRKKTYLAGMKTGALERGEVCEVNGKRIMIALEKAETA